MLDDSIPSGTFRMTLGHLWSAVVSRGGSGQVEIRDGGEDKREVDEDSGVD